MRSAKETYDRLRPKIANGLREHASLFLLTAAIVLALKQHYSQAGSDDLTWILRPTAWLVERWSSMSFDWEPRSGFVNHARRIVIAPACAGVNFLIVTFSMAACAGLVRLADKRVKLLWILTSLFAAYALTVLVNTIRIIASIVSYEADFQLGWLTADRWHRLQGVMIYFFFLCLFYRIITAIFPLIERREERADARCETSERSFWMVAALIPLCWYMFMILAVPFLNKAAAKDPTRFFEHSWMVVGGCLAVIVLLVLAHWLGKYVWKNQ